VNDIRKRFTANAEEFDSLMMEMLGENESLRAQLEQAREELSIALDPEYADAWLSYRARIAELSEQLATVKQERDEANTQLQEYKDKCISMMGYVDAVPRRPLAEALKDSGEDKQMIVNRCNNHDAHQLQGHEGED